MLRLKLIRVKGDTRGYIAFIKEWWVDPDSKVYGVNMGLSWGQQDPPGPHVGPMNFVIWGH